MEKKTYISPLTITVGIEVESHLLDASIDKGTGGNNTPEAKEFADDWSDDGGNTSWGDNLWGDYLWED